ncbi:MAG: hypothetical protein IJY04_05065 [Clostridia bacterium]|nr:hypothetical protein [Clostridia bacterium]
MIELIKEDQPQFKSNLHCHSTMSDGKLTPEELKAAYRSRGYSVLSITDHEYPFDHSALSEKDFLMLTGYEAYIRIPEDGHYDRFLPEVHINLLARDPHNVSYVCFNDRYCKYVKDQSVRDGFTKVGSQKQRAYTPEYVNEFVRTAHENGYICTHNHAYWSMEDWSQISQYEGFFSMEMCNYSSYVINRLEYNAQLYDKLLREGKRIFVHSADDNHNNAPFDSPRSDSFGGFTMIMADELTYSSVFDALEKGNFYSSMGPTIHSLSIDGDKARIKTDPALQITMFYGSKKTETAIGDKASPVTEAEFTIPEKAEYVRFSVLDFEGRYADTRGFFRDELGI